MTRRDNELTCFIVGSIVILVRCEGAKIRTRPLRGHSNEDILSKGTPAEGNGGHNLPWQGNTTRQIEITITHTRPARTQLHLLKYVTDILFHEKLKYTHKYSYTSESMRMLQHIVVFLSKRFCLPPREEAEFLKLSLTSFTEELAICSLFTRVISLMQQPVDLNDWSLVDFSMVRLCEWRKTLEDFAHDQRAKEPAALSSKPCGDLPIPDIHQRIEYSLFICYLLS